MSTSPTKALTWYAKHRGLERVKTGFWRGMSPEVTTILHLQKSAYGGEFFINLGFAINSLSRKYESAEAADMTDCHVRVRLRQLDPELWEIFCAGWASGSDGPMPEPVVAGFDSILDTAETVEGLRGMNARGLFRGGMVMGVALDDLES